MTLRTSLGMLVLGLGICAASVAHAEEASVKADADSAEEKTSEAVDTDESAQGALGGSVATAAPDDVEKKEEALPPRVPWRGTNLSWTNAATTTALGIGQDVQSRAHEMYTMAWALRLNYVVIDQDKWSLSVTLTPSMSVELTDSGETTTKREVWFQDLPLTSTYQRSLYAKDGFSTGVNLTGGFIFPTSKPTIAEGTYLYTTLAGGLTQGFPLLDAAMKDAPLLNSLAVGGNLRWDHRFGKADVPVDGNLDRPRQNAAGVGTPSDVLSFGGIAHDSMRESLDLSISQAPGGMPLNLAVGWIFSHRFLPDFHDNSTCDVLLETGCVDAEGGDNFTQHAYGFQAGLDFMPVPEVGIGLAYFNVAHQLKPDGTRRSPFYSPYAQFNATLTFNIDAAYERITGPPRKIAKGEKKRGAL